MISPFSIMYPKILMHVYFNASFVPDRDFLKINMHQFANNNRIRLRYRDEKNSHACESEIGNSCCAVSV